MFGFIKGLFGSGDAADDGSSMEPKQSKDAYFLEPDAASTLGDVNYMRSTKSIKRTYAKTVDSPEEKETVKQVSAMNKKIYEVGEARPTFSAPSVSAQNGAAPTTSSFTPTQPTPPAPKPQVDEAAQRRKTDTNMDMFRNMAKDIRK
jgi:hypothetical protein